MTHLATSQPDASLSVRFLAPPLPANARAFHLLGKEFRNDYYVYDYLPSERPLSGLFRQSGYPGSSASLIVDLVQQIIASYPYSEETSYASDTLSSHLTQGLLRELGRPNPDATYISSLATTLRLQLARFCQRRTEQPPGLTPYQVKQVRGYVLARIDQPLRLNELAAYLKLSRFYFARRFKQATGQAPGRYIIQLKMRRAKELLATTDCSVIEAGMEVGYENPSHFSSTFKKCIGSLPSQMRNALRS